MIITDLTVGPTKYCKGNSLLALTRFATKPYPPCLMLVDPETGETNVRASVFIDGNPPLKNQTNRHQQEKKNDDRQKTNSPRISPKFGRYR